jgi:hypothetical protein
MYGEDWEDNLVQMAQAATGHRLILPDQQQLLLAVDITVVPVALQMAEPVPVVVLLAKVVGILHLAAAAAAAVWEIPVPLTSATETM